MQLTCFAALVHAGLIQANLGLELRVMRGECVREVDGFVFPDELHFSGLPSQMVVQAEATAAISKAQLVTVIYVKNFKVLTDSLAKEQYVLTQCGSKAPTDAEVNKAAGELPVGFNVRKHFTVPVQTAVATSTVLLGFVDLLGVEDRFTHVSQYATGACWQKSLSCGAKLESNYGGNMTLRSLQFNKSDAVFMDCASATNCKNVNKQKNAVHFSATQDAGNLHSAEYVKFLAAFFNKEKEANEIFETKEKEYQAAKTIGTKPTVAWISYSASLKYFEISQATYKLQLVEHAGGKNQNMSQVESKLGATLKKTTAGWGSSGRVWLDSFNGSQAKASVAFFDAIQNAEVLIDETYPGYGVDPATYTMATFLKTMNLTSLPGKTILRIDGTISDQKDLDWYESRVANPDLAVDGLARAMLNSSKPFKYFRNLNKNEAPQVITASECKKNLFACKFQKRQTVILVPGKSTTEKSTTNSTTHSATDNSNPFLPSFNLMVFSAVILVIAL